MDKETALKGALDAETHLRTKDGTNTPSYMSEHMARLAQYLGALEQQLAELERKYEEDLAAQIKLHLIDNDEKVTRAELLSRIAVAKSKGEIAYYARIVASGWRQVGVVQSRYNHLDKERAGQI